MKRMTKETMKNNLNKKPNTVIRYASKYLSIEFSSQQLTTKKPSSREYFMSTYESINSTYTQSTLTHSSIEHFNYSVLL